MVSRSSSRRGFADLLLRCHRRRGRIVAAGLAAGVSPLGQEDDRVPPARGGQAEVREGVNDGIAVRSGERAPRRRACARQPGHARAVRGVAKLAGASAPRSDPAEPIFSKVAMTSGGSLEVEVAVLLHGRDRARAAHRTGSPPDCPPARPSSSGRAPPRRPPG